MESIANYKKEKTRKEKKEHVTLKGKVRGMGNTWQQEVRVNLIKRHYMHAWMLNKYFERVTMWFLRPAMLRFLPFVMYPLIIWFCLGQSFWLHALDHLWTNIASICLICCWHQFPMFQAHLQYGFPTNCGYNIVYHSGPINFCRKTHMH